MDPTPWPTGDHHSVTSFYEFKGFLDDPYFLATPSLRGFCVQDIRHFPSPEVDGGL
jgi:hypothetical protein